MPAAVAKRIQAKIEVTARAYSMDDIFFPTFELRAGYSLPICASDVAHVVTALLECASLQDAAKQKAKATATAISLCVYLALAETLALPCACSVR